MLFCTILPLGLLTPDLVGWIGYRLLVCYWFYPLTKQTGSWQLPNGPMGGWPSACSAYHLLEEERGGGWDCCGGWIRNVADLFFLPTVFLTNETWKKPGSHKRSCLPLTRSATHVSAYQAAVQGPDRESHSHLCNAPQSTLKSLSHIHTRFIKSTFFN